MLFAGILRHPVYTPDGMVYARFAARDAGQTDREATLSVRAFYERTPLARAPRYRALVEIDPSTAFAQSQIFANRILYPRLVSLLLPAAGFRALFIVTAIAYVAFAAALFWALAALGRPWQAAALAGIVLVMPLTRDLAASDLTDMLAAVWWTLSLGALLHWLRTPRAHPLIVLAVAAVLLALTRPTPYLVVIPALAAAIARRDWRPFAASCAGIAAFAAVALDVRAFGAMQQLRWIYEHEAKPGSGSLLQWYRSSLFAGVRYTAAAAVRTVIPVVLAAAMVYAWMRGRMRDEAIVLLAAALACLLAVPFNPVTSAIARVVVFPLLPVFAAMAQAALTAVALQRSSSAAFPSAAKL